jgi:hypothetical protein
MQIFIVAFLTKVMQGLFTAKRASGTSVSPPSASLTAAAKKSLLASSHSALLSLGCALLNSIDREPSPPRIAPRKCHSLGTALIKRQPCWNF